MNLSVLMWHKLKLQLDHMLSLSLVGLLLLSVFSYFLFYIISFGGLIFSSLLFRYIHTENKEIVPGHPYSAEYCKVK